MSLGNPIKWGNTISTKQHMKTGNKDLINSWASSCFPYPRLPPILGNLERMFIGENG